MIPLLNPPVRKPRPEHVAFHFKNVNQAAYYTDVMKTMARMPGYDCRYFFYGGAIRGGKTFVCLYIFWKLARLYPNSRWHIFREDNPALESTTIPSMEKLIGKEYPGCGFKWKRGKGSVQIHLSNGSKIFFKSENIVQDKELKELLGLETNGIMLEQMEALSPLLLTRAMERVGSWYIKEGDKDITPVPIILGTFNPTNVEHVKKKIYDPWTKNELAAPWYFRQALPNDNPDVTAEQWKNWENLDEESRMVMIEGKWIFAMDGKRFAYAFDEEKHVIDVKTAVGKRIMAIDRSRPVHVCFDFNVDPITCIVCQRIGMYELKVFKEYRLRNSDIFELLERVKADFGDCVLIINADASGRNRSALTKGNRSFVTTIQKYLHIPSKNMQIPKRNPSVRNTRVLMNSLFSRHERIWISSECVHLINDLNTVLTDEMGEIDKGKDKTKTHLFDTLRYIMWYYFKKFVPLYPVDVDQDDREEMREAA